MLFYWYRNNLQKKEDPHEMNDMTDCAIVCAGAAGGTGRVRKGPHPYAKTSHHAGRRKKRRHPSAFAKKPQSHANKNTAIPLHGALKKSLHEHSRFSLCPSNSASRAPQLKDSLPPCGHLPSCARMAALPSPCRPCPACRSLPCPVISFRNLFYISFFYPLLSGNKYASTL